MISFVSKLSSSKELSYVIDLFVVVCILLILAMVKGVFGGFSKADILSFNFVLVFIFVHGLYNWLFWTSESQATLGMAIFGLKIEDNEGKKLDIVDASLRHILHYLFPLNFLVNMVMSKLNRSTLPIWHEAFSATRIVKEEAKQL